MWDRWIKPLLDEPGSTYKVVQGDISSLEMFDKLIQEGMFPHQKHVQPGEPDCQRPNDTLLVTGTLIWDPKLPGYGFDSMTKQLLLQYAEKTWKNKLFHSFGPVRSLLWMAHDVKSIIPRSELHRGKYDFFLETLSNNKEVVTQEHTARLAGRGTVGREPQQELESLIRALQRGRENGFELPAHRRENVHDFADDVEKMTDGTGIMSASEMHQYLRGQEYAGKSTTGLMGERFIESVKNDKALEETPNMYKTAKKKGSVGTPYTVSAEGKAASFLRASVSLVKKLRLKTENLANLGEDIYKLECRILGLEDGIEKEEQLGKLRTLGDEFNAGLSKLTGNYRPAVLSEIDDRLAIRSPVRRLAWDSRPYEPLIAKPEEVWPPLPVSLIDSTPRLLPPGKTPDWYDWLQDFAAALLESPSISVITALEHLQHGAADLVTKAPSLTDPKRGGRLDMQQLRVRMLTVEMVEELCQAYREWPFRNPEANHTRYFRLKGGKRL
jgi:transcription factor 1